MERSRIYIGWAKTAERPNVSPEQIEGKSKEASENKRLLYSVQNAKRAIKHMEEIAPNLLEYYLTENSTLELSVQEKAQMFLGYLTPIPRGKKAATDTDDDQTSADAQ